MSASSGVFKNEFQSVLDQVLNPTFKSTEVMKIRTYTPMTDRISPKSAGLSDDKPKDRVKIEVKVLANGEWITESVFMFQSLNEVLALVRNRILYDKKTRRVLDDQGYNEVLTEVNKGIKI
jgi:hypothetical protein